MAINEIKGNKTSRYNTGSVKYFHKGKTIPSTVGSLSFDNYLDSIKNAEYDLGAIPAGYDSRPDLISHLFFGSSELWWKIMIINGIQDPFEGLSVGNQLLLPKR